MNPAKHSQDIAREQACHPGKCLYHLAKSHPTEKCGVKLECDELLASCQKTKSPGTLSSASGQLRHITEETFTDAASEEVTELLSDSNGNDTNEESLYYFARLTNHYLRLVKSSDDVFSSRHPMRYPIIADSGANFHMFRDKEFFEFITPATGSVLLGDGQTSLPIRGVGTVKCKVGDNILNIEGVRYIPDLAESIYSLFLHIKLPGHGLSSSYDSGLFINFTDFQTQAIIGKDDVYIDAVPLVSNENETFDDDSPSDELFKPSETLKDPFCRKITQFQEELSQETEHLDNILRNLRRYYKEVKSKRQLGLEVPAGFRSLSELQKTFQNFSPPRRSKSATNLPSSDSLALHKISEIMDMTPVTDIPEQTTMMAAAQTSSDDLVSDMPTCDSSHDSTHLPIIRSVDKVSSTLPIKIAMTEDYIKSCVGFRKVDTIKKFFSSLYTDNVILDNTPPDAILDSGDLAT